MISMQDQISAATRANVEAQLAFATALTSKAFEGFEKLVDLNLTVAKTSLEESNAAVKQLLSAKDAQEFFSLAAAQTTPSAEKAVAYARHIANIATNTQNELSKTAEAQIAESTRKVSAFVDDMAKNAPAGSENVIAIVKSLIGSANAGYEQLAKTTKQAVEAIETNLNTATTQFTQAAEKATGRSKK